MGTSSFAVPSLKSLLASREKLVGVFTQPDRAQGRGLRVKVSPIKALALQHNLPIFQPEKINQDEYVEAIKNLSTDLIVVAAYGQIIPQRILDLPKFGPINVHASILPKYRGSSPINWAIIRGEQETGVTTMMIEKKLDTGAILLQKKTAIHPEESAGELHDRLAQLGSDLLLETITRMKQGKITPRPQEESEASYIPLLKKEDGLIDWKKSSQIIHNQIRGMNPWPGAYTYLQGKMLKVFKARPVGKETSHEKPGMVLNTSDEGILVSAGENAILLVEVQLENHKRMTAGQFLRGRPIPVGVPLGC